MRKMLVKKDRTIKLKIKKIIDHHVRNLSNDSLLHIARSIS